MRARAALYRHLQTFFETQTRGIFSYDDAMPFPAQKADQVDGKRRFAFGKIKEIVEVRFGEYEMIIASPNEAPPLGKIKLRYPGGEVFGPMDCQTWNRAGEIIRQQRTANNG